MLERIFSVAVVWPLRMWYPILRLIGRLVGQRELVERLIEASEQNIERTMDALRGEDG